MSGTIKQNPKKLKQWFFLLFLSLLFVPYLQKNFRAYTEKPLTGELPISHIAPDFSIETWKNSELQTNYETYFKENIGFRNFFIRLQNQINYSVFNISKTQGVVIGKEGYLYLQSYIEGYTGANFPGEESIDIQVEKAKLVQEELKKKNIDLIFVFVPGKASYFPEYIPRDIKKEPDNTVYSYYKKAFKNSNINCLDIREYFLKIKDTLSSSVFPAYGVHWTDYGAVLAADSMINYIEKLRGIRMNCFKINSVDIIEYSKYNDAADLLNLFTNFSKCSFSIPKLVFENDSLKIKPTVLMIADSYYWAFIDNNIPQNIFNDWHYWFQKKIYPESHQKIMEVSEVELKSYIERQDIIMIMGTEASSSAFPYDFIDNAWEIYAPKNKRYYDLKKKQQGLLFRKIVTEMKKNKAWMKLIKEKAKQYNKTIEQSLFDDALWVFNIEINKKNKF